jgi:hypothetical protein
MRFPEFVPASFCVQVRLGSHISGGACAAVCLFAPKSVSKEVVKCCTACSLPTTATSATGVQAWRQSYPATAAHRGLNRAEGLIGAGARVGEEAVAGAAGGVALVGRELVAADGVVV